MTCRQPTPSELQQSTKYITIMGFITMAPTGSVPRWETQLSFAAWLAQISKRLDIFEE
jgi:hypothetical protein